MIRDHQVVVVIPAGRRRYLSILIQHLLRERAAIDAVDLWLNTRDRDDLAWMKQLWQQHRGWVRLRECPGPVAGIKSIRSFYPTAAEPGVVYVRLDDDIVWIEPEAIAELVRYRLNHPAALLVCGNIVNNAICTHLHQRTGALTADLGLVNYECMDAIGWRSPTFAEAVHRKFLHDLNAQELDLWRFGAWHLLHRERFSINAICWHGEDLAPLADQVDVEEEEWWTTMAPEILGRTNVVYGGKLFAHFGFFPQRAHLDKTDLLGQYRRHAPL